MALWPFHGRAEWAAMPLVVTSARSVPLQPPSTIDAGRLEQHREVGVLDQVGALLRAMWSRPLNSLSISSPS